MELEGCLTSQQLVRWSDRMATFSIPQRFRKPIVTAVRIGGCGGARSLDLDFLSPKSDSLAAQLPRRNRDSSEIGAYWSSSTDVLGIVDESGCMPVLLEHELALPSFYQRLHDMDVFMTKLWTDLKGFSSHAETPESPAKWDTYWIENVVRAQDSSVIRFISEEEFAIPILRTDRLRWTSATHFSPRPSSRSKMQIFQPLREITQILSNEQNSKVKICSN